jgi:hypothetical protein
MSRLNNSFFSKLKRYFGNATAALNRGYRFQNNPPVQLLPGIDMKLQLAIDTAQYSRIFEDRFERVMFKN